MSSIRSGHSKRPEGPAWPIDATWKAAIRQRLQEQDISQAELARRVNVRPSAIVALLRETSQQSRLVPAIHAALGLLPPVTTIARAA